MKYLRLIYNWLLTIWEWIVTFVKEAGIPIILGISIAYLIISIITASRNAGATSCI